MENTGGKTKILKRGDKLSALKSGAGTPLQTCTIHFQDVSEKVTYIR